MKDSDSLNTDTPSAPVIIIFVLMILFTLLGWKITTAISLAAILLLKIKVRQEIKRRGEHSKIWMS